MMTINKSKIKFEESYYDDEDGMITLYFNVPKSWLPKKYKGAKYATVSIECPELLREPHMCTVMISPTRPCQSCLLRRILKDDSYEDYDWTDWDISDADIRKFLEVAERLTINKKMSFKEDSNYGKENYKKRKAL